MNHASEAALTDRVLAQYRNTPDPRLRQILSSLITHLHGFARETGLTFAEWQQGIAFLTRVGQMCTGDRQEFILLSDVLGLSMLVDTIDHRNADGASESTILGPFFVEDAPDLPIDAAMDAGQSGVPLRVTIDVKGGEGQPLPDAEVIVWHSDNDGLYDIQHEAGSGYFLRGRFRTDAQGCLRFWTITPPPYPIPDDGPVGDLLGLAGRHPWRPAHVHFLIAAEQHRTLVTHLFIGGGDYLDSDVVFGVKQGLVVDLERHAAGRAPDGRDCPQGWNCLSYSFCLAPSA